MKRTFADLLREDPALAQRIRKCPPDPRQAPQEAMEQVCNGLPRNSFYGRADRDGHKRASCRTGSQ